jgi:hypothetical protein
MTDDEKTDSSSEALRRTEQRLRLVRMRELPPETRERLMRLAAEKLARQRSGGLARRSSEGGCASGAKSGGLAARRKRSGLSSLRPLAVAASIAALVLLDFWLSAAQTRRITRLAGGSAAVTEASGAVTLPPLAALDTRRAMLTALLESPENL